MLKFDMSSNFLLNIGEDLGDDSVDLLLEILIKYSVSWQIILCLTVYQSFVAEKLLKFESVFCAGYCFLLKFQIRCAFFFLMDAFILIFNILCDGAGPFRIQIRIFRFFG